MNGDLPFDQDDDVQEDRYWVVLANGTLKSGLSGEQYDRYSNAGKTIDGGKE